MDIYFAGTPNSAAEILKSLASNSLFNIKGVITQPDKKGKRGNQRIESPVSLMANSLKIQTYKPNNLTKEHIQNDIDITSADILLVVAYGNIIPTWILESKIRAINIHYSLLPSYRGASPIQSSLLNNDKKTGVTFMQMSEDLDAGKVIKCFEVPINKNDNKSSLEKKLTKLSILNLEKVIADFYSNKIIPVNQDHEKATYCKKILKEDSIINFKESAEKIFAKFRAFNEWPGICFLHKNKVIKIHGLEVSSTKSSGIPGDIISFTNSGLTFKTVDYDIVITHLQFPNKNIITVKDAYNSYRKFFV
ncbi:methionyl-tRNA formyltransferase [Gammaproteobacteria bacterium]|nr:methionyl-tRNA formyltransferase [Gammaproteobacteria bacterium]